MESSQLVRFTGEDAIYVYDRPEEEGHDWVRESCLRTRQERSVTQAPRSELERMHGLVASWRKHETCIVFGNLGRQPHLLNYFLDLCFGNEDDVRVESPWKLPIPYQTQEGGSDFLFLVEPYFGFSVQKPPSTQHLVVLTSHMNLSWNDDVRTYLYHLPTPCNQANSHLQHYKVWKPPVFHSGEPLPLGIMDSVLLDVTDAKSTVEAYLRLLTGREMIRKRPFQVRMSDTQRTCMEAHINLSRRRAEKYWPWMENVYWSGFF